MFPRMASQMTKNLIGGILLTVIIILLLTSDSRTPTVQQQKKAPEVIRQVVFLTKPASELDSLTSKRVVAPPSAVGLRSQRR